MMQQQILLTCFTHATYASVWHLGGVAGVSPAEGVATNKVGAQGKAFPFKTSPQKVTSTGTSRFQKSTSSFTRNTVCPMKKSTS